MNRRGPTKIETRLRAAVEAARGASSDFDLNPGTGPGSSAKLRRAGVLIAVRLDTGTLYLTKRGSALKHHPGQIAFPGGKMEPSDANIIETALREAEEEIALPRSLPRVIGTLPPHETVTGFEATPVLTVLDTGFEPRPDSREVAEVFEVPLAHVLNPANYAVQGRMWRGAERRYYTVPLGPYYIWGATARMLRGLAEAAAWPA